MAVTKLEDKGEIRERELTPSQQARLDALDEKIAVSPRPKKQFSGEDEEHIELLAEAFYRCLRRIEAEDSQRERVEDEIQGEIEAAEAKLAGEQEKNKPWRPYK